MSLDLLKFYNSNLSLSWFNKVKCKLVTIKTISKNYMIKHQK